MHSMNHIYRLVWSQVTGGWVVVAETARGRIKGSGRSARRRPIRTALSVAAMAAVSPWAQAGPTGGQVVSGTGTITQSGAVTTIKQGSQNLSLGWATFNVAPQEAVDFVQPSASAIAVNRIADTNGSQILGQINANGQVYLINPNGILFGAGAQVNVGGLVASTLDTSDAGLAGITRTFTGTGSGSVNNLGTINAANGGFVALIGNHVGNQGTITAQLGTVALGAGNSISLTFNGSSLVHMQVDQSVLNSVAENGGLIRADGGTVVMTAGAADALLASVVNNTGLIEARTVQNVGNAQTGTITLLGGMGAGTVNVGGTLDASAPNGGDGGFVETSAAKVKVADGAKVSTLAASGLTGSWLIDPTDYTVAASGGDITGAALGSLLNSSNISISSASGGSGTAGNVNIDAAVTWSTHKLTITATNDIDVNAVMNAENNASVDLEPGSGKVNMGFGPGGFSGQINFFTDSGTAPRSGAGFLTINSVGYTVITSLGAAGSTTGTDLQGMQGGLSGHYALGANINASATSSWNSGTGFTPVGFNNGVDNSNTFAGTFDGLGHTITGLTENESSSSITGSGLFGVATGAFIRNVGLVGGSVRGGSYVGGLAGATYGTAISNSFTTGSVSGASYVGGLLGQFVLNGGTGAGSITRSYATGNVTGTGNWTGGLVGGSPGFNGGGPISNSFATGNVSGSYGVGGLAGNNNYGSMTNVYATGTVSGSSHVGGLIGWNYGGPITTSFATGAVSGSSYVGGLVGLNSMGGVNNGVITHSYSSGNVGALVGVNNGTIVSSVGGESPANMEQSSTFAGFDFGSAWAIYNGHTTPLLQAFMTPLTVKANTATVTYNGTNQSSVTYSSYGATIASPGLSGTLTYTATGSGTNAAHAGTYTVTPGGQYSGQFGYLITDASGTLTVNAATLTPTLTNSGVTKAYNGNANAPSGFTPTYSFTGLVSGDTAATLTDTSVGYNSAHVASATGVTVSGLAIGSITGSNGSLASDYTLAASSASVAATITAAPLTATLTNTGVTKTYDGTTSAPSGFAPTYSFTGLVSGDTTASLTDTSVGYNSAHVASATGVTVSGLGIGSITGSNGSQAGDYALSSSSATVAATITAAPVTISLSNTTNVTKTYDGTAAAPSGFTPTYSVGGLVSGDSATISSSATPVFNSAHVVSATAITQTGLSLASISGSDGSQVGDYALGSSTASTGNGVASITPVTLTVATPTIVGSVTKTYDGTAAATGASLSGGSVSGAVSGDTLALNTSGISLAYDSAHVASATSIHASGSLAVAVSSSTSGSLASDYSLGAAAIAPVAATITPAPLTIGLSNTSNITKTYDGTTAVPSGFAPTYSYTGLLAGDSATLGITGTPVFNSAHVATATRISQGGISLVAIGDNGSDGSVLSDYALTSSVASTGTGIAGISPIVLSATAPTIAGTLTKTYDGGVAATGATLSGGSVSGALSGDTLALDTSGVSLNYNSSHVATASSIGASGSLGVDIDASTHGSQSTDYSVALPSVATVAGTITPASLTATLTNTGVTKTYDGTTSAPSGFVPGYGVSGFVAGDTGATLTDTGATYDSAHVASATGVTVSGLSIGAIAGGNGSQASDYALSSNSATVAATITPASVTVGLSNTTNVTKTYDGTTAAPSGFAPTYSVTGLVPGDSAASVNSSSTPVFNSAHVATATTITQGGLSLASITGADGSQASDYALASTTASTGNGIAGISPATLTATLTNSGVTKTYDGTTNAPSGFTPTYGFAGLVSGDTSATLTDTSVAYNSAHVATASDVTASGLAIGAIAGSHGSQAADYALASASASVPADITPAPLTVGLSNTSNLTKTYDGTTAAPSGFGPTYSFSGLVAGDSATASSASAPVFNSAHVATATTISQGGLSLASVSGNGSDGSLASDYALSNTTASTGVGIAGISPLALTATAPTIVGTLTKTYDGTTAAPGATLHGGSVDGALSGDTLTLDSSGATLAYNGSHVTTATSIGASGNLAVDIEASTHGSQSTDYSVALPSIVPVAATITAAPVTVSLANTTNATKTYDGTTAAPSGFGAIYSVTGLVPGDSATVGSASAPVFNSAHVATATTITQGGLSLASIAGSDGSLTSDYALTSTTASTGAGVASISPIMLTTSAPTIAGTLTKTYDGTTAAAGATLGGGSVGGALSGDDLVLDTSAVTLAYDSSHVASASSIVASGSVGLDIASSTHGSQGTDYSVALPTVAPVAATITAAPVTVSLTNTTGATKTYDGTTAAPSGFGTAYGITGLVAGDSATVTSSAAPVFNSSHVAAATTITQGGLSLAAIAGGDGSLTSDYALTSTSASTTAGVASISPATLTATLTNTGVTKTYDGTANAPAGFAPTYGLSGLVTGDTGATLTDTSVAYNSAHAANATGVTVSGLAIGGIAGGNGSQASDYVLSSGSATVAAAITPASVTVSLTNTTGATKTYDGTTAAPSGFGPTYGLTGLLAGDSATVGSSSAPVFNSAHVTTATTISQGGLSLASVTGNGSDGSLVGDYALTGSTASTGAGVAGITPAPVTATAAIGGITTKVYDGSTAATGATVSGSITGGAVAGDTLALDTSGISLNYDTAQTSAKTISASGNASVSVSSSTVGSLASDYSLTQPTIAPVAGAIAPAVALPSQLLLVLQSIDATSTLGSPPGINLHVIDGGVRLPDNLVKANKQEPATQSR